MYNDKSRLLLVVCFVSVCTLVGFASPAWAQDARGEEPHALAPSMREANEGAKNDASTALEALVAAQRALAEAKGALDVDDAPLIAEAADEAAVSEVELAEVELVEVDEPAAVELPSAEALLAEFDEAPLERSEHDERALDDEMSASAKTEAASMERVFAFFDLVANTSPGNENETSQSPSSNPLSGVSIASLRALTDRLRSPLGESNFVLAPYVSDPRWFQAMDLMRENKCQEALTLASTVLGPAPSVEDGEPAVVYAYARMQMCGGQEPAGRAIMAKLARGSDAVAELARRRLGMGKVIERGADDEEGGMYLSQRLNQARTSARKNDQVDLVLAELGELRKASTTGWDSYRIRMIEAQILEDAGRNDQAQQVYLGIYRQTRTWRSSDQIIAEIERAEVRLGLTIIPFGDRIDRMNELIARGRYQQARTVAQQNVRLRNPSASEVKGWTLYRQALESERDKKRELAVSQFEQADKLINDLEMRSRLYFGWARALRRLDRDREAIALYERLCDEFPSGLLCDESLYEAGRLYQFLNEHEKARAKFFALVGMHPFSEHVPDALWRSALSAYLVGDFEGAIPPLKDIVEHYGDQKDESELTMGLKAKYWIGVSALKSGNRVMAARWLQDTINSGPLTWYGRLAVARMDDAGMKYALHLPDSRLTAADLRDFSNLRVPENSRLAVASEMVRIGLWQDALQEVRQQIAIYPVPEGAQRLRGALHLALGEPNWGHWIMKSEIAESGPTHASLRDWGTAFPLDYMEISHKYGTRYGVSPFLVQAIIRQESGFRPTVSSYAGAMGLMQLMPTTARYTARVFLDGTPAPNDKQILDPETNIRLGTMYIRVHTAHAVDHIPLALAGYNAGPAPLKSWMERYGDRELDVFVESITYQEARGYVRKVMTSYITYAGLYGDGTLPNISLKMPDKLRRWGQIPEVKAVVEGEPVSMLD
ncbi:MAG: transglycosylase SLT domain-containing protein [Bradymonadaceae bacterium]|nr:transglycosylase SLT domain-containing protein [Lujinxingiaceae bacterium]